MLRKYRFYIFLIFIGFLVFYFNYEDYKYVDNSQFHIDDISLLDKVFLADRNGNMITLKKKEKKWVVNDQFFVRKDAINTLLLTANRIRVKRPVSKSSLNNVIKYMATTGVVVEFFIKDKVVKSYTIGSNTPDHLANYMLLKYDKEPQVVHIPSFNGFLSPRYGIQANTLDINNWRSNTVFDLSFEDIYQIRYTDYINKNNSYYLKTSLPFELFNSNNLRVPFNNQKVLLLLNSFNNLNCESFKKKEYNLDLKQPLEELIVNNDTLKTYSILELDNKSKENNFNVERKYARLNNGELMLIQDYVFNKVLINIKELTE